MPRRFLFLAVMFAGLLIAPASQAAIKVEPAQAVEGQPLKFKVTGTTTDIGGRAFTKDGSAKSGENDYTAVENETVEFPLNADDEVEVATTADSRPETDETVILEVRNAQGAVLASGTGTITNDDTPSLSVADVSVGEDGGTARLTIASQAISAPVAVDTATSDVSAQAGSDYDARSGTVTIPAGQASATVDVSLRNDTEDEEDESFKLALGNAKGASIGDGDATVTVTNDDIRLLSVGDVGVVEGDGEQTVARLPVQLSGPTFRTVSLAFITIDSSAKAPRDYLARFGSVVFQPGQTQQFIDIAITADEAIEPNEVFGVLIGQEQGARILRGAAVAAIRDDDGGPGGSVTDMLAPRMKLTKPKLSGSRAIRSRVSCPRGEQRCKGRLVLYTKVGRKERRIGARSFTLPGDASRTLSVAIPRSILSAARRKGRLPVRAYMVTSDAADNVDTKTMTATLRLKRPS
jgi:hypothetical protein